MNEFIIIANGPDRTGIVSNLSKIITDNSGNIKKSRMTTLAGDFVIIMLLETKLSKSTLESSLTSLNLNVTIKNATPKDTKSQQTLLKMIYLSGTDNEGLVYSLTDSLSKHRINIHNLTTKIVQAPITGINLFSMEAKIEIPKDVSLKLIKKEINFLKDDLGVDIKLKDI